MNIVVADKHFLVTLSKRNLQTLLSKVDREGSHATLCRETDDGYLTVHAQSDEVHYRDREPGAVHPLDDPCPQ